MMLMLLLAKISLFISFFLIAFKVDGEFLADSVSELSDKYSFKNKAFSETSLQQFSKQFSKFLAKTVFPLLFRYSFFIPK